MISINTLKEDSMSNIDFPNSPSNGDTYSYDGKQWTFDGEKWETSGGSKGQKGEPGPGAGDKGAKGEPGVGGSTGPSGNKGEKGESGPQGAVGPQGSGGAQGPAGPTGPTGSSGDKGDKGEVGAGTTQSLTLGANGNLSISSSNNVDLRHTQFLYSATSDLPNASTYHGAIGHVHAEGALYFAHGGSWNKLQNDIPNIANSAQGVDVTGMVATSGVNISTGGQLNAAGTSIDFQSATISFSGASVSGLNGEIRDVVEVGVPETFSTVNAASGVTALDCNNGHIFYLTSPSGDVTANFTNLYLNANYATNLSVVVNQGATPREVTAIQIEGTGQTINWQGGSAPTGTANGIDVFSFTILRDSTSYIVLGQMVDFT